LPLLPLSMPLLSSCSHFHLRYCFYLASRQVGHKLLPH
jgi:hypothetical protein